MTSAVQLCGFAGDEGACADFQITGDDSGCAMYHSACQDQIITPGDDTAHFACFGYVTIDPLCMFLAQPGGEMT